MKRLVPILALFMVAACGGDDDGPSTGPTTTTSAPYSQSDLVVGTGEAAVNGNIVTVAYTGWLYDSSRLDAKGSQFDSRTEFVFRLGIAAVIQGWDRGVVGMRVGGQRRLIIPPELAYGAQSPGPGIPANATLVFDITLNRVQ